MQKTDEENMGIFFTNNEEQKAYVWNKLNAHYSAFTTCGFYYRGYLQKFLKPGTTLLDAGSGEGGIIAEFKHIPKRIIGIDNDKKSLNKNTVVTQKIYAPLENIPLSNNSCDIVTAQFVLEHLKNPRYVFKKIARVLKPGCVFIFLTPNILNPVMLVSKMLPLSAHKIFRKGFLKKTEQTYQTFYRANTCQTLVRLGRQANLTCEGIKRAGNPEYLAFCKPLVLPAIFLERLIDNQILAFLRMYLIGYFRKGGQESAFLVGNSRFI